MPPSSTGTDAAAAQEQAAFETALRQSPAEREAAKKVAQEACSAEEVALLECYRAGSFLACTSARKAFWECYKKHRVRNREHSTRGKAEQECAELAVCQRPDAAVASLLHSPARGRLAKGAE